MDHGSWTMDNFFSPASGHAYLELNGLVRVRLRPVSSVGDIGFLS